jgi:hypothetical protein
VVSDAPASLLSAASCDLATTAHQLQHASASACLCAGEVTSDEGYSRAEYLRMLCVLQ